MLVLAPASLADAVSAWNLLATRCIAFIISSLLTMRTPGCSWAVAERYGSPLLSTSAARCGSTRCDRIPVSCSRIGGEQAPPQADARPQGCPPAALSVGRRGALELGASALLLALAPPLPSSAASSNWAPAVIRPELAPDQRLYDAADPQVRGWTD